METNAHLWIKARNNVFGDSFANSKQLAELVGVEYPDYMHCVVMEYSDELIQKLQLLASPHGKTIMAAMKAKKEET